MHKTMKTKGLVMISLTPTLNLPYIPTSNPPYTFLVAALSLPYLLNLKLPCINPEPAQRVYVKDSPHVSRTEVAQRIYYLNPDIL